MHCFNHDSIDAVGSCAACRKAVCKACIGRDAPRIVCTVCTERGGVLGFEYKSSATFAGWPLVHICSGVDAASLRPKIAKGVIAIGNIAIGGIAIAGISVGLVSVGGLSIGLLFALGGGAIGLGLSLGGLAIGSVAVGGLAVGYTYALGGQAIGPAVIDALQCDPAAREFFEKYLGPDLPPSCR